MNGFPRLIRRVSALPEALYGAALSVARDAAADGVRTAKTIVPVRTGALRASIAWEPLPNGARLLAARPYALYVEAGTCRAAAQPYLLPAARMASYPARAAQAAKEALP